MKVTCDKCRREFDIILQEKKKLVEQEEITKTYFVCPFCKKEYVVGYDNKETITIKQKIRVALSKNSPVLKKKNKLKKKQKQLEQMYKGE